MTEVLRESGTTKLDMYIDGRWSQAQSGLGPGAECATRLGVASAR